MSEQLAGWSEWIDWEGGECPIPWAKTGEYSIRWCNEGEKPGWTEWICAIHLKGWDGEVKAYRYLLSAAPAGFVPPGAERPWYPPVPEGFGPWVEWTAGCGQPVAGGVIVDCLSAEERAHQRFYEDPDPAEQWSWAYGDFVAYCVKLEDQPTTAEVEATQQPWYPSSVTFHDKNEPMFNRDDAGVEVGKWDRFNARQAWQKPTDPPAFMVRDVRSSDGLLTVRECDHRLGLWE